MVAADQRTGQLAFAYRSSKRGDGLLLQAAGLAGSLNMQLAVVVPFVLPADGPGCCGIRGRRWEDILRQVAEEDAERARRLLDDAGVPHSVTLAEGPSVPDIVEAFASERDRQLALPETPSGTAFTRSTLRRTKRLAAGTVRGLAAKAHGPPLRLPRASRSDEFH